MPFAALPVIHAHLSSLSRLDLAALADGLLKPEPWVIERCVEFVVADTRGLGHGRARALMCRRLKHCRLGRTHRTSLLKCVFARLASGSFSEQFKDQLRLALRLDSQQTYRVALGCVADPKAKSHVRRYAAWVLAHKNAPRSS